MGDAFDLKRLAVGDEVGIEWERRPNSVTQFVAMVTHVDADGSICIDGDEWFMPDGRCMNYAGRRLCAPTDEGRTEMLRETIYSDLDILSSKRMAMSLPALRRLHATLVGLIAWVESPVGE